MKNVWMVLSVLALTGCDTKEEAEKKCLDLRETFCDRFAECAVVNGALPRSEQASFAEDCNHADTSGLDCSNALSVDDGYEDCLEDTATASCALWDTGSFTPSSCRGVINTL